MIKKNIKNNIINLGFIQIINIFVPLIVYPLSIHRLGMESMGTIVYYQGLVSFFAIFINYGFYITGAKYTSENRNDKKKLSEVVCSILLIKVIIWFFCLFVILLVGHLPFFKLDNLMLLLAFLSTFYELLFMQWFFQGVEKLKIIVILNGFFKAIQLLLIYSLVLNNNSSYIYLTIISSCNFFTGLFSIIFAFKIHNLLIVFPQFKEIKKIFLDSGFLFLANITNSIKDRLSLILIGNNLGMSYVASYDLAIRIINMSLIPINLVVDAIFPSLSRNYKSNKIMILSLYALSTSLFFILIEYFGIEHIVRILSGENNIVSINLAKIALIAIPIISVSTVLGKLGLIASGKNRDFLHIVIKTVSIYIILIGLLYLSGNFDSVYAFLLVTVFIYAVELLFRYISFKKY
ncbi:TPA: oligosaccharide flippase family protein [Photobacterium damselae]